ncbi:thermonuclease family protein [Neisseria montereyensis]|uniref:Thermonuclease family protein n=1 Tax=Neisseria montereyensis TaxID=2973938 RepID=A0ABT2FAR4_9NEIS|nr:thermonuclease family protein [Neisseria montereyensis]MCS4533056.1 thermonuclease family protein [Neisseria montereyensis]
MKKRGLIILCVLAGMSFLAKAEDWAEWLSKGRQIAESVGIFQEKSQNIQQYSGKVVKVSDGDTVWVVDSDGLRHKIRLAYIDAPESQQAHGKAARDALNALAYGKTVEVWVFDRDRYKREVAQIRLNDRDLNLAQIEQGHAWHYVSIAKRQQSETGYALYAAAEMNARYHKKGLWRQRNPQAPWDFRRREREKQESAGNKSGRENNKKNR